MYHSIWYRADVITCVYRNSVFMYTPHNITAMNMIRRDIFHLIDSIETSQPLHAIKSVSPTFEVYSQASIAKTRETRE